MTAWVVRGGSRGEWEPEALDNGFLCIGFGLREDLSGVTGRDGFTETLRLLYPDSSLHVVRSYARQVWFFVERIQPGDLAVMPRKGTLLWVFSPGANFLASNVNTGRRFLRGLPPQT